MLSWDFFRKLSHKNTFTTIEASKSNSDNLNNNINRISKLLKSLITTMPTFDWKSKKFKLFENLFHASLKTRNQLIAEDNIHFIHSPMRGDGLQTLKDINSRNRRESLAEILTVFRRKNVKPQWMATAEKTNFNN